MTSFTVIVVLSSTNPAQSNLGQYISYLHSYELFIRTHMNIIVEWFNWRFYFRLFFFLTVDIFRWHSCQKWFKHIREWKWSSEFNTKRWWETGANFDIDQTKWCSTKISRQNYRAFRKQRTETSRYEIGFGKINDNLNFTFECDSQ